MPVRKNKRYNPWVMPENIKWLILFFILAFAIRIWLSTMYVPADNPLTDQHNYLRMNMGLLDGNITSGTRFSTLIMAPLMLFFSWFGFSYLTSTILAGCLISALTIIPLWMIAEHLKIYPKLVALLYVFSAPEIIKVLNTGSYTTELGILLFSVYLLLLLKGHYIIAPIIMIPQLTHEFTAFFMLAFVLVLFISYLIFKRNDKYAQKQSIYSLGIILLAVLLIILFLKPSWVVNDLSVISAGASINAENVKFAHFASYIEVMGSYLIILALLGILHLHRENKGNIALFSFVYLPSVLAFLPILTSSELAERFIAFGAPGIALLAAYAFRNWKSKHWTMKALLIIMVAGTIYYTVSFSIFQFYQHSVGVLG